MNMNREDQVNKAMKSLEGVQRAQAPHGGFAKIQQRLADQRKQQQPSYEWLKIAAVISLVVCSNIWAVSTYLVADSTEAGTSGSYPQIVFNFNLYDYE